MRVLVTGNLGYIGPVVVRRLREAGHYVVGVDTGWYVHQYAGEPEWPDVQFFGDIRDPGDSWFHGVDAAVHMAGLSNDPIGDLDPDSTEDVNYAGTLSMLVPGVRNLMVSSCSVYGVSTNVLSREDSDLHPQSIYAKCKADVDRFLASGLWPYEDWVSLRLGTVYGYSPGHRLDLVVNRMVHDALANDLVRANGNAARPLTHVEDAAAWFSVARIAFSNVCGYISRRNIAWASKSAASCSARVATGVEARAALASLVAHSVNRSEARSNPYSAAS